MKHISHYLKPYADSVKKEYEDRLEYPEFMRGMCNAPIISFYCNKCCGLGLKPVMCCDGLDCGCRGKPVDFIKCDCGSPVPSNAQIRKWAEFK